MFVETITAPRAEWEQFTERLRILADPPEALVASVAWDAGDGTVTATMPFVKSRPPLLPLKCCRVRRRWRDEPSDPSSVRGR